MSVKRKGDVDPEILRQQELADERLGLVMELVPPSEDQPDSEIVHRRPHMTRAFRNANKRGTKRKCGHVQLMAGGGMFGNQLQGPIWEPLWGLDYEQKEYKRRKKSIVNKYEASFKLNNPGAAYEHGDMLEMTRADFRSKLDEHEERTNLESRILLLIITLCCSRASPAGDTEKEEAKKFYEAAIRKSKEFISEAEKDHQVFVVQEFLDEEFVLDIIKKELPDSTIVTVSGHIHEDRKRAYVFQRAEGVAELFMEELRARVDAYGPKSVAEALEEVDVALPPGSEILSGCHSSKERRLAKKGRDPFLARVTTICTGGQYVHKLVDPTTDPPTVVEERLEPEAVLHLRSAGADYEYVFPDSELKGTKNDILGMGVSLVIGSAVRAAFERYFEPELELSDGGLLPGRS